MFFGYVSYFYIFRTLLISRRSNTFIVEYIRQLIIFFGCRKRIASRRIDLRRVPRIRILLLLTWLIMRNTIACKTKIIIWDIYYQIRSIDNIMNIFIFTIICSAFINQICWRIRSTEWRFKSISKNLVPIFAISVC